MDEKILLIFEGFVVGIGYGDTTVLTGQPGSYSVVVPINTVVNVGDVWPPVPEGQA